MTVPTSPQNSISVCQSRPLRASRDAALADRCQQTLEAWPIDADAGAAKIIVDDLDCSPAELSGAIGEPVLTAAALQIVQQLIGRRLADVDKGAATQMISRDLDHHQSSWPPAPPRSRATGLSRVLPVVPSVAGSAKCPAPPA